VAHRNEDAIDVERRHGIAMHGVQPYAGDTGLVAQDLLDHVIPKNADFTCMFKRK